MLRTHTRTHKIICKQYANFTLFLFFRSIVAYTILINCELNHKLKDSADKRTCTHARTHACTFFILLHHAQIGKRNRTHIWFVSLLLFKQIAHLLLAKKGIHANKIGNIKTIKMQQKQCVIAMIGNTTHKSTVYPICRFCFIILLISIIVSSVVLVVV